MTKKIAFSLLAICCTLICSAQRDIARKIYHINGEAMSASTQIDPFGFYPTLLDSIIIDQINFILDERDCEPLQFRQLLFSVAKEQSEYMSLMAKEDPNAKLKLPVGDRMQAYGGSNEAAELVARINVVKGKEELTYFKMAEELVFKWMSNSKTAALFESTNYR